MREFHLQRRQQRQRRRQSRRQQIQVRQFSWLSSSGGSSSNNPISRAYRQFQLKLLERKADANPNDPVVQYQFVSELAENGHPGAVIERIRNPAFARTAVNVPAAVTYLRCLQRTGQYQHHDTAALLSRLSQNSSSSGFSPQQLQQLQRDLQSAKLPKSEQVQYLLNYFLSGGAVAVAGAVGATAPAMAAATGSNKR